MAIHTMHLVPSTFIRMKEGRKTIELRLYDEKRKQFLFVIEASCFSINCER